METPSQPQGTDNAVPSPSAGHILSAAIVFAVLLLVWQIAIFVQPHLLYIRPYQIATILLSVSLIYSFRTLTAIAAIFLSVSVLSFGSLVLFDRAIGLAGFYFLPVIYYGGAIGFSALAARGARYAIGPLGRKGRLTTLAIVLAVLAAFFAMNTLDRAAAEAPQAAGLGEAAIASIAGSIEAKAQGSTLMEYERSAALLTPLAAEACRSLYISPSRVSDCTNVAISQIVLKLYEDQKKKVNAAVDLSRDVSGCLSLSGVEANDCVKAHARTAADCGFANDEASKNDCVMSLAKKTKDTSVCAALSAEREPDGYSPKERCELTVKGVEMSYIRLSEPPAETLGYAPCRKVYDVYRCAINTNDAGFRAIYYGFYNQAFFPQNPSAVNLDPQNKRCDDMSHFYAMADRLTSIGCLK